jgi:molybdopterin-guanine dinucleotide biosynthesis protein A
VQPPSHPATQPVLPAIILAGGSASPEFAAAAGVENRALAEIHGAPMVRYVLRALREAETVSRIVLVAPAGFPPQAEADELVAGDGSLVENIRAGLAACPGAECVLLVTADVPFLRPESVDDYVRTCEAAEIDCGYAAIPKSACQRQFPGTQRTYLPTGEGYTGGNVVFQRVATFERQAATLERAYRTRKNPLSLAAIIGLGNMLKLVTGRLQVDDISRAASRLMGVRARLIVTEHADLGTDVDKPEDLHLARELLRSEV